MHPNWDICEKIMFAKFGGLPRGVRVELQMANFISKLPDTKPFQKYTWDQITIKKQLMP